MNKKGFTLIELLAIIFILGIVSIIATTSVVKYMTNAKIDAFAVEASNVISGTKNVVSIDTLNKLNIENNENSCKIGNRMCFTIDTLIELGVFKGNKDIYKGKVNIDISDKNNLKYKLFLEKKNEFNIVDSSVVDYSKNKDVINKGGFSGEDIEEYTICSCVEDKTKPIIEKFYIEEENQEYLTKRETKVYLKWLDEDVKYYCVTDTNNSNSCNWVESNEKNIEIYYTFESDGEKTLYAFIKDKNRNISEASEASIGVDTQAPTSNSVSINNGAASTTSTSVTLTLASSGATQMCISNTSSCSSWETYATSKSHTLTTGDGTKTVYVWFRDAVGNTTSYVTDTITLDTQAPTSNSVKINNGATSTTSTSVTLTLSSSGASQMCISNTSSCSSWETYATSKSWTLSSGNGTKTVYVWYKDAAGNTTSSYVTDTITLNFNAFGTYLRNTKTAGFNSTMEGGLYRYQGTTNVNNYVCFGTSDKSTCTGNTNRYMFRIIGVNSSGQVKLIKKEELSWMSWGVATAGLTWPQSKIYTNINGSYFLTNTTILPSGWSDKIATYSWKYGDITSVNVTASSLYNTENAWTQTVNAKIGLMYAHDYAYAYQSGGLNCSSSGNYTTCKTSWIHLSNNDTETTSNYEYIMSRSHVNNFDRWFSWRVEDGAIVTEAHDGGNVVRPVFYLTTAVGYVSGSGTSSDPFIIS